MKDYLIKFGDDGRRGATYADGVHYQVASDGIVQSTSIDVDSLLQQGYVFVDANDYNNLLGNNSERREYCRQPDGSFVPYVAPPKNIVSIIQWKKKKHKPHGSS